MVTSIWVLLLIISVVLTWHAFAYFHRQRGETAEQKTYANFCEPIFVEQTFFGTWWQERAVQEYDLIKSKLKEHGNQYLDPETDVYLFIHRLDVDRPISDFSDWRLQIRQEQYRILENFFVPLADRANASGDKAAAARFLRKAGRPVEFVKENGQYE